MPTFACTNFSIRDDWIVIEYYVFYVNVFTICYTAYTFILNKVEHTAQIHHWQEFDINQKYVN